uniref:Cyclic nucleotide-binding domain-containing protein n=1 Tax=Dendroctonus ponderosae TaxID=77166 RepID=A0AAR5P6U7_DENPD
MLSSSFFVHMLSCLFYLVPIMNHDAQHNLWVLETKLQPNCSMGMVYFGVFSLVQSHFWGLGETSVRVKNHMEEFVLTIVMIVGRIWSLIIIATMLRGFTISSLSESKYEQYLLQLRTFICHKNLPKEMEERLLEFYEYKYQREFFNEKAIISALSHYLKEELNLFKAKSVISKVHLFKCFPRSMIAEIISKCKILVFMNNDFVTKRGDLMDHVYFISTGTVAVFNEDRCEMIHLTDGDEIGIRSVTSFYDVYFTYTYVSIETTEMYTIPTKDLR